MGFEMRVPGFDKLLKKEERAEKKLLTPRKPEEGEIAIDEGDVIDEKKLRMEITADHVRKATEIVEKAFNGKINEKDIADRMALVRSQIKNIENEPLDEAKDAKDIEELEGVLHRLEIARKMLTVGLVKYANSLSLELKKAQSVPERVPGQENREVQEAKKETEAVLDVWENILSGNKNVDLDGRIKAKGPMENFAAEYRN